MRLWSNWIGQLPSKEYGGGSNPSRRANLNAGVTQR